MAIGPVSEVLHYLRRAVPPCEGAARSDGQLLEDFVSRQDEAALEALVNRHARLVWGVCRRILHHEQDAEDAFQTTFLVLIRRAGSIVPREKVCNWLHGVAQQTALKARATAARRRQRERNLPQLPEPAALPPDNDLQAVLDQELGHLPERYRLAILLCDLQGRTRKEAAQVLGVPEGTVAGRLARARKILAERLSRRGLVPSVTVPARVLLATVEAARTAALTRGVLKTMLLSKLKMAAALLAIGVLAAGVAASGLIGGTQPGEKDTAPAKAEPKPKPAPRKEDHTDAHLRDLRVRMQIAEQSLTQLVQTRLRQAREGYAANPEVSLQVLRDILTVVWDNPDIGERVRDDLLRQIVAARLKLIRGEKQTVWTLDFHFKAPRLVLVNVPGQGRKVVTYLWYQVANPTDGPHTFIPQFELAAGEKVHSDKVLPGALETIRRLEDPTNALDIKDSVSVTRRPIPPSGGVRPKQRVTGVAMWEDLPPNLKSITVYVSGLSNAWSLEGSGTGQSVRRKVLRLRFRKVDREMVAEGRPEWAYRSTPVRLEAERLIRRSSDQREVEIAGAKRRLAGIDRERQGWQKEREQLRTMIEGWKKVVEGQPAGASPAGQKRRQALLRELQRQLEAGDLDDQNRQIEQSLLGKRLEALRRR